MNNTPILITGCQRSGTTLLNLILDSHPDIKGIDEKEFKLELLTEYFTHPDYHPYVAVKLPKFAHLVGAMHWVPNLKILWCIRDPRDVIASMLNLMMPYQVSLKNKIQWGLMHPKALLIVKGWPQKLSWAVHPRGAAHEIDEALRTLRVTNRLPETLHAELATYAALRARPPLTCTIHEAVFLSALCWRLKHDIFHLYAQTVENVYVVQYEHLIRQPQQEIGNILQFLGLPWHENVLKHHELHSGLSTGNTDNTRPIDETNMNKWQGILSEKDVQVIQSLCAATAQEWYGV